MPSKLTSADIYEIVNQAAIRSRPLRVNYSAIKNKINEIIDALAAAAIGTTNAETTAARPYHASLLDRLDSMWKGLPNYKKYGGAVTVNSNTAKCDIAAGEAKIDGVDAKWSSAISPTITGCAAGKHRIDIVVANSDSTISIVTGAESTDSGTSPQVPDYSFSQLPLAYLYIDDSAPIVLTGNIHTNYSLQGGSLAMNFLPNDVKYITLNDTTADFTIDTSWISEISLVGTMTLIVTHHSAECTLTFNDTAYHINIDGAVASQDYTIPAGATKRTIFQIYYDGTSLFVMENPFYVVS